MVTAYTLRKIVDYVSMKKNERQEANIFDVENDDYKTYSIKLFSY